jgi:hypothetical protein
MQLQTAVRPRPVRLRGKFVSVVLVASAGWFAIPAAVQAAQPDFGPNVLVIEPSAPSATIQAALDAVSKETEFGSGRHAVLFKPGTYALDAQIGYYTTVAGLGFHPDDVVINGGLRVEGQINTASWTDSALINFWRSVENLSVTPTGGTTRWAVSQASPMRRVHIRGGLALMPAWWGYSSGGFIADSQIDGEVQSGSQQQWYSRDSLVGSWAGSVWNMVFSGVQGAPAQSFPSPPMTTLASTPRSREKPFLYIDGAGRYQVFKPDLRIASAGTSWTYGAPKGKSISIDDFLIANPATPTAEINRALTRGKNVLFTPGVYKLTDQLEVTHRDTVLLGLGMATLVPAAGKPAIATGDADGIAIAGLIVDAGPVNSPVLVRVGERRTMPTAAGNGQRTGRANNPILVSDLFFRIGGATAGTATVSLELNASDAIVDHVWAWRADHGAGAGWNSNAAATGVVVNGDDVTALGLFVEHYQKQQVVWNGNGGTTIFYQSELPYDPPSQAAWMDGDVKGYASYNVGKGVSTHKAYGLGVYSFFNAGQPIVETRAIAVPAGPGIQMRNAVSVFLSGSGEISHVINNKGTPANATSYLSFLQSN